jgi:hypothetical protein
LLFVLLSKMYGGATFDLDRKVHMAHIAIILSENNLSDIIIEEIVCRNTCFLCNYNIWITFYIFLWNYESIKVGVQLVFNTIWEWHRFTAVIWENDTKSFIFPKLKMISLWIHNSTKRCKRWFICYNCTQNKYFYTQFLLLWCQISYFLTKLWQCEPYGTFGQDQKWLRHTFWTVKQIANTTSSMFSFIFLTE